MKKSELRRIIRKIIQEQASIEDVPDRIKPDGSGGEPPAARFYCDDPEAINYTPNADPNLIDNSVCKYYTEAPPPSKKLGCKNKNDINYCDECVADTDPTSCAGVRVQKVDDYRPGKIGCIDDGDIVDSRYPGYAACNFDNTAEVACDPSNPNNDCCEYKSCMGCMVSSAEGYDPLATIPCPNNECCGDRRQTMPKKCTEWSAACNYEEDCPEDFEGDDCCTWDCNNAQSILSFSALMYAYGPCGGPLNSGQDYQDRNPDGCCSTPGGCLTDMYSLSGDSGGPSPCILDAAGYEVSNYLADSALVENVCGGVSDALSINTVVQSGGAILNDILNYTQVGIQIAEMITVDPSLVGNNEQFQEAIATVQGIEDSSAKIFQQLNITQYELNIGDTVSIGILDVLTFCNDVGTQNIINQIANYANVDTQNPFSTYNIIYQGICALEAGVNFLVFGPEGMEFDENYHDCCGDAEWSVICGGGLIGYTNYQSFIYGISPDFINPTSIMTYINEQGWVWNGPFGEGPGDYTQAQSQNNMADSLLSGFGTPTLPPGLGYCMDGMQPSFTAELLGAGATYAAGDMLNETLLKTRLQKLANIQKKK